MNAPRWLAIRVDRPTCVWLFLIPALLIAGLATCQTLSAAEKGLPSLRQKERIQQQARAMAAELVTGVLDIQLRQLKENKLDKLPIYSDLQSMRANIDELVDRNMQQIIELLVKAQKSDEGQRQEIIVEARKEIREVVVALMAERQRLYKRMQLARIAAQTRQLIGLETKVLTRTQGLPQEQPRERERMTLSLLEDQRDVAALYYQLVGTLEDIGNWEGPVGAGASKGLRLLKTLQADQELKKSDEALSTSRFADAESAERAIIKALRALLEIIEEAQGLEGSDRSAIARMVDDLIKKQEKLREETRATNLQDIQKTEQFAQQQHAIHDQLGQLAEALNDLPTTAALIEQAKASAYEAEAKIFEADRDTALQKQGEVIGALAEIGKKLEQSSEAISDKTAEQLALEVQSLEKLDKALDAVRAKQKEAEKHAPQNATAAKAAENQVAQQLTQANAMGDFGPAIETRLTDAQEEVARAQQTMQDASPQKADDRKEAAAEATRAIDQVATEVKQTLADARRRQLAVEIGELARSAEALERAAAAERELSDKADLAARSEGLNAEQSKALSAQQGDINHVAKSIAAGVKAIAPKVAQQLAQAQPSLDKASRSLQAAQQNPGEGSKAPARDAAEAAKTASAELTKAAAALRKEAGATAKQLAQLAGKQLEPVVAARHDVEQAAKEIAALESPAEKLAKLHASLDKTHQAQIEQARASGQTKAAEAQELAQAIDQAVRKQMAADDAANDFISGRTNSPLAASAAEREVAETAADLAKKSPAALAPDLQAAADAAAQAAKEMVVGNPNKATSARQAARDALERAKQKAQESIAEAAKQPAGTPDRAAQARVSELTHAAGNGLEGQAPDAAAALQQANTESAAAEKALTAEKLDDATGSQAKAAESLAKSAQALQQAIDGLAKQQVAQAQQQQQKASAVAEKALPVDAGAAVALQQAERAAQNAASQKFTPQPDSEMQPEARIRKGFERAEASLAAREQQLRRDQSIAEAIAQLAQAQQAARDEIERQAEALERLANQDKPKTADNPAPESSAEQQAAAQSLSQATDQFADAQRATGEGAAEISGQEQIANQPIREGLEAASKLGAAAEGSAEPTETATANAESLPSENGKLGTGFVPESPEFTAKQIAGSEALAEAMKALAQLPPQVAGEPLADAQNQLDQATDGPSSPSEKSTKQATRNSKESKQDAQVAQNQEPSTESTRVDGANPVENEKRDSRSTTTNQSEDIARRNLEGEPWFANLPPALQKAIQAKSRRNAPRGYEERLKRYFESVD